MSNVLSLERYRGIKLLSSCSDTIHSHFSSCSLGLGLVMLLFGLMSFALGISAICVSASASYTAYGIWCGFMFVITACLFMATMCSRSACLVTTMLVFGLISFTLGVIQFSLAVKAATVDADRKTFELSWGIGGYVYDVFNSKNIFYGQFCSGDKSYNYKNAWGPVNILLAICGFIEMFCSLIGIGLASKSLFCGVRRFKDFNLMDHRGYMNSAYDGNSMPQLYKINEG